MLKMVRVFFWAALTLTASMQLWAEYQTLQWQKSVHVALYPVNPDSTENVSRYIASLKAEDFDGIEHYFSHEAMKYRLPLQRPIRFHLGPEIAEVPPAPPAVNGHWLDIILWSLKFRWFNFWHQPDMAAPIDIRLYVLYYDASKHTRLHHSTALHKGRIGRVNLFAHPTQHAMNTVVIAHELLHALSATDKYDLSTHQPVFPQGYAEPYAASRYPQSKAEIMAGRIPLSAEDSLMAVNLDETLIGRATAREIGWSR